MTINTSSLGGGGQFIAKFASNTIVVAAGQTGTFITLTPPSGQRVKLTGLAAQGTLLTSLTTVLVNGSSVITGALLNTPAAAPSVADHLKIGYSGSNQEPITGNIDEAITISTNVATSSEIIYTYQFGV